MLVVTERYGTKDRDFDLKDLACRYRLGHLHPLRKSCDSESFFPCPVEALESSAGPVKQSLSLPSVEA